MEWYKEYSNKKSVPAPDAVMCDIGLSGLACWENIIDNMIDILKPRDKMVVMDWYIENPGLKGKFVKWIGKGQVERPIWHYFETKVDNLKLYDSFGGGDVFVASGNKK